MLRSVVTQTKMVACHVVVSDGDPEAAVLFDNYCARNLSYRRIHVKRPSAGGPAVAWNTAIRAMPKDIDWLIKIDADDVAHETLVAELEDASANADVVVPAHWHFGDPVDKPDIWIFPKWSMAAHLSGSCIPAQSAVRRKFYDRVGGFDETMPSAEDWDFFYRIGCTESELRVVTLRKALWGYRQHSGHRASGPFHEHHEAYQDYVRGHTRETVLARSRSWAKYCDDLKHGNAPWLVPHPVEEAMPVKQMPTTSKGRSSPGPMDHYYQTINGGFWFREAYERIFHTLPKDQPSTWVEVGVFHGQSLCWLGVETINSGKPVTIIGVDNFAGWPGVAQGDALRESFEDNVAPLRAILNGQFRWIVGESVKTASQFDDNTIDVVWLDADHSYDAVKADIRAWWPKVREGGLIGGDDWAYGHGVKDAVDFCFPNGYELLPGTNNGSSWPSWIVRKPLLPRL